MNSDDYSPAPSGTFSRTPSIDPTKHVTYVAQPTAPSYPSLATTTTTTTSLPLLTEQSQRSLQSDLLSGQPPVRSDVRRMVNSRNEVSRDLDTTRLTSGGQAPGLTGNLHNIQSSSNEGGGVVGTEAKAPTMGGLAERDRSNNNNNNKNGDQGGDGELVKGEGESVNPQDYVGVSLVGKKFKQVNPEAYYVEKDDPYNY